MDFIYIELIRYKSPSFYTALAIDPSSELEVVEDTFRYKHKKEDIAPSQQDKNKDAINPILKFNYDMFSSDNDGIYKYLKDEEVISVSMENLFPQTGGKNINSISKVRSFDQYFMYRFDEKNITATESIQLLIENDKEEQLKILNKYYFTKKEREIYNMVDDIVSRFNVTSWNKDINSPFYYINVLTLFYNILDSENEKLINEAISAYSPIFSKSKYHSLDIYLEILRLWDSILYKNKLVEDSILLGLMNKTNLQSKLNRELSDEDYKKIEMFLIESKSMVQMSNFIYKYINPISNLSELVLSRTILKDIQLSYFFKYAENVAVDDDCMQLFYNCIDFDPESNKYFWNDNVKEKMRELVDKDPQGYISMFVSKEQHYINPLRNWQSIFNDSEKELEIYLFSEDKNDLKGIDEARIVWKLYKYNGFKEIDIINSPFFRDMGDDIIIPEMEKLLDSMLAIKEKVDQIKFVSEDTSELEKEKVAQLLNLEEELNNNSLPIKLKVDIIKEIDQKKSNSPTRIKIMNRLESKK